MNKALLVASAIFLSIVIFTTLFAFQITMFSKVYILPLFGLAIASSEAQSTYGVSTNVSLSWHAPNASRINKLGNVINGTDVYGFAFNGSYIPSGNTYYGGYNWYSLHITIRDRKVSCPSCLLTIKGVICRMSIPKPTYKLPKSMSSSTLRW